jgi:CRP-like cAMP-binding protein
MVSQELLSSLIGRVPEFRKSVLVYSGYTLSSVGRAVACNAYHSIGQRLARWLLMTQDHVGADEFSLTHDLLSQMLAATRPRVSLAAGRLRAQHIIDYRRGQVKVLDRARLELLTCECYEIIKKERSTLPWAGNVVPISSRSRAA